MATGLPGAGRAAKGKMKLRKVTMSHEEKLQLVRALEPLIGVLLKSNTIVPVSETAKGIQTSLSDVSAVEAAILTLIRTLRNAIYLDLVWWQAQDGRAEEREHPGISDGEIGRLLHISHQLAGVHSMDKDVLGAMANQALIMLDKYFPKVQELPNDEEGYYGGAPKL